MDTLKNAAQNFASTVNIGMNGITSIGEQTILVTGASGFVAAHVLNEFLDHGYNVRGTVRSKETAAKVRKTHAKYGDKLSFAIVEDVAAPGAFDEAVKGVNGVSVPSLPSPISTYLIDEYIGHPYRLSFPDIRQGQRERAASASDTGHQGCTCFDKGLQPICPPSCRHFFIRHYPQLGEGPLAGPYIH